jgi:hypothetical protein
MPFRSDIKPESYGESARKPVSVDEIEDEAYDAIKKLEKKGFGVKAPFFLHNDYYEDEFPFLAIGESSGLTKKFAKKKRDDEVAYGNVYVVQDNGEDVVYFEYVNRQGLFKKETEWEKVFKIIKKWLKAECRFVIASNKNDNKIIAAEEDETNSVVSDTSNASTASASTTATVDSETDASESTELPKRVVEMTENYEDMLDFYEELASEQNEPDDLTRLYRAILKWEKYLKRLPESEQEQLVEIAANVDKIQRATAKRIRANEVLSKKLDELVPLVEEYAEELDAAGKADILEAIETIDKISDSLDDYEVLEQTAELKGLLNMQEFKDI